MWYVCVLLWIRIWHQLIYNSPKSTAIWGHRSPIHPVIAIPIALWSWHEPTKPLSPAAGRSPLHLPNSLRINIHFCICDLMTRTGTIIIGFSVYISHCCFCDSWTLDSGCIKCYVVWCVFRFFLAPATSPNRHAFSLTRLALVLLLGFSIKSWYSITLLIVVASETASATCHTCHHNRTVVTQPAIHCLSIRRKTKSLEKRLAKAWLRSSCKQFDTTCGSKSKDPSPKR